MPAQREIYTIFGPDQPGNILKYGIVGYPNSGKSLLYNVLTEALPPKEAVVDNALFSTLETQIGHFKVPDERLDYLVKIYGAKGGNEMTAIVGDCPGLVEGSWTEEEGEGQSFLSNYRNCDVLFHVMRGFENRELTHYHESVDPLRDVTLLNHELLMHDLLKIEAHIVNSYSETDLQTYEHQPVGKHVKWERWVLLRAWELLVGRPREETKVKGPSRPTPPMPTSCAGLALRYAMWEPFEKEYLERHGLLTIKPIVYLLNVSVRDHLRGRSAHEEALRVHIQEHLGAGEVIPMSFALEMTLLEQKRAGTLPQYLKANPTHTSKVPYALFLSRRALRLITFYVANPPENTPNQINFIPVPNDQDVQPFYCKEDTASIDAAALIDTNLSRYFNRLMMYSFHDLRDEDGNFDRLNEVGKYRAQQKRYPMNDGDVCQFLGYDVPKEELPPKKKKAAV
jgi:obg-like ATPase 1